MAAKKPAADSGITRLKRDIKANEVGSCYIFYGEEDYLRSYYVERLTKLLVPEGMEMFNLYRFEGKDLEVQTLEDCVDAFPMMSERKLILVYDFDLYKNEERRTKLEALLRDLPEYVCLVFIYDTMEYKSGGNTKLGKLVKEKAAVVCFAPMNQSDLNAWIHRRLRNLGKDIDNGAAEYLTFLCGGLITGLNNEVEKLAAYAKGDFVTKADIDAVADPVLDAKVFQMTDAIGNHNYGRASELLGELYQMKTEPIPILASLGKQLRQIWSARLGMENRKGQDYLIKLWNLRGDWQARKLSSAARRYDLSWCRRAILLVEETDIAMKSSGLEQETLLTELLLKLANM